MRNCVGEFWTSFKISIRMNMVISIEACLQTCSVCEWWPVDSPHKGFSGFPHKGPLVYSFEIFFVIGLHTTWSKHSRSQSFNTPWYSCDIIVMLTRRITIYHDDVIKWKNFPRYWPFVRGIHRSPVNSPHKGHWRGALILSLIFVWINSWVNNSKAGDSRRYRVHYDVSVMW